MRITDHRWPWIALALAIFPDAASAETILARCGPSTGQSYYFETGFVGPGQGGLRKDGFDGGRIFAYINNQEKLDLIIKDTNGFQSYLKEGYKVNIINLSASDKSFLIAAYGPNFAESYVFRLNNYGVGTVSWTGSKLTEGITKTSMMTAECGPKYGLDQ
jgi:hypothetical protein